MRSLSSEQNTVNTKELLNLEPLDNLLSASPYPPAQMGKSIDLKTPSTGARLKTMDELNKRGFTLAAHFDPIIYQDQFKTQYSELLTNMRELNLTEKTRLLITRCGSFHKRRLPRSGTQLS